MKVQTLRRRNAGSVMVPGLIVAIAILGMSMAAVTLSVRTSQERVAMLAGERATQTASAGVAHAVANLHADVTGNVGTVDTPVPFSDGNYWASVTDNGDGTYTVVSSGTVGRSTSAVEAVLAPIGGGVFAHALFAGNSSGDPQYTMGFGGVGDQADFIDGDVYSGGDIELNGTATVTGELRATGQVTGAAGDEGVTQPIPDIAAMNYETTSDFDVAALFAAGQYWSSDAAGGSAWQLPESNPAHIFRKNPSDRTSDTEMTAKDDYFLEDPHEPVGVDSNSDGSDAYAVTLSGVSGQPGPSSNQKVFFIDGNLWLHNKKSFSFGLEHNEADGVQITFVVKGNVYFSDNLFYGNPEKDGVAFIAIKDDQEPDSGNIYFGDPTFGTLEAMHAFMYAENNFYDNNLDASGSAVVEVYGNMTAGNQVVIQRDYGDAHSKLGVHFDDRIISGDLEMPSLPVSTGAGATGWQVVSWRRVAQP